MLVAALSGLAIPIRAAPVDGVNLVDGAEVARERRTRHALSGILG